MISIGCGFPDELTFAEPPLKFTFPEPSLLGIFIAGVDAELLVFSKILVLNMV